MIPLLLALSISAGSDHSDPARYTSPDGRWSLEVDPSSPRGVGPAKYRCQRGGEIAWEGSFPFTLDTTRVMDNGLVLGCARACDGGGARGALLVVRITPRGSARICAATALNAPRMPDSGVWPWVRELTVSASPPSFRVEIATYPDGAFTGWRYLSWEFAFPSGDVLAGAPPAIACWMQHEWTPDPIERVAATTGTVEFVDAHALEVFNAEPLGTFDLEAPVPKRRGAVAVASDGRIAILDVERKRLELFDADGRARSSVDVALRRTGPEVVDATADGGWIMQGEVSARLDRAGAFVEADMRESSLVRVQPVLSGSTHGSWRIDWSGIQLLDAAGVTQVRNQRGADRRWLRLLSDLTVTPDGGAVVLEVARSDSDAPDPTRGVSDAALHVLSPAGELVRTIGLLPPCAGRIVLSGATVFMPVGRLGVIAVDLRARSVRRIVLCTESDVRYSDSIVPARGGQELWRFRAGSASVERFAVPNATR